MKKLFILCLMLTLNVALGGCFYLFTPMFGLLPPVPTPPETPPVISNLSISPGQLKAGEAAPLSFSFDFEDVNADVESSSAMIEIQGSPSGGSFSMDTTPAQLAGLVVPDPSNYSRRGRVTVSRTINIPASAAGSVSFSITLYDNQNNRSNSLSGQVSILAAPPDQGGGVGPGAGRCTIIDGNKSPVTTVRIGRQIFFRVVDPDNNFSSDRQDRLFRTAAFQGGASGDFEIISWLLETGTNTGVFEGPPGGIMLTSTRPIINDGRLSVLDNDTVMAYYEDPNGPGDVCIAIAKVF